MRESEMFHENKYRWKKIRFFGFDGVTVMSGEKKGLQRRLRHFSPYAVYIIVVNIVSHLCLVHLLKFPWTWVTRRTFIVIMETI